MNTWEISQIKDNIKSTLCRLLCLFYQFATSNILSWMQVLNLVADALTHEVADVRTAACICLRSVSRSIKVCAMNVKFMITDLWWLQNRLLLIKYHSEFECRLFYERNDCYSLGSAFTWPFYFRPGMQAYHTDDYFSSHSLFLFIYLFFTIIEVYYIYTLL